MIKGRMQRYKEKIGLVEERLSDVEGLINETDDKIKRLACYKAFQEVVEAFFDLIAMLLKDKNKTVEDDYKNLDRLEEVKIINKNNVKILQEANGLRNRIIHEYNKTDDKIAKESMRNLLPKLNKIVGKFKNEIN